MAIFFAGGAIGSALVGAWGTALGGWALAWWIGFALPAARLYFATA